MYEEIDGVIICTVCHNDCYACVCMDDESYYNQISESGLPSSEWAVGLTLTTDVIYTGDDDAQQG